MKPAVENLQAQANSSLVMEKWVFFVFFFFPLHGPTSSLR